MIYIGIDTGVHTGIAIWDNRKRSLEMVKQMTIHRAMAVVQYYEDMQKTGVGDYLTELGVEFEMVAPKRNITKMSQEYFKQLTGWKKQTNEHSRDAAMLVFGF